MESGIYLWDYAAAGLIAEQAGALLHTRPLPHADGATAVLCSAHTALLRHFFPFITKESLMTKRPPLPIHALYEAAVQNVDTDLDFGVRVYTSFHKKKPQRIREDFCGTAKLAGALGGVTLIMRLGELTFTPLPSHRPSHISICFRWMNKSALPCYAMMYSRQKPLSTSVLCSISPSVSLKNVSRCAYFQQVYRHLRPGGMLVLDLYGGTESVTEKRDDIREIPGFTTPQGLEIPDFEYVWDQVAYNPINHYTQCEIHFNVPGWKPLQSAFRYDWRLWTLPEISEILAEAGFSSSAVYLHDFDEDGESDEIFRRRKKYQNVEGCSLYSWSA